jgi:hypothetical protein
LPPNLLRTQQKLMRQTGGDRSFVNILHAVNIHGMDIVESACHKALSQRTVQGEIILNLIAREVAPPVPALITPPPKLQLREEPIADCARYDELRKEVCHATA